MKINKFSKNVAILFAIVVGLYPILHLVIDMKTYGLLQFKTKEVLNSRLWNIAFYTHIFTAGLTLLIGWPQFNAKRRSRFTKAHRILGRIYLTAVGVSSLTALYVSWYATGGFISAYGFGTLAIFWFASGLCAFLSIRKGHVEQHKKWMILNYSLTFAGVTLRFWGPFLILVLHVDFMVAYRLVSWLCWVPNMILAFLIIASRKTPPARSSSAATRFSL